MLQTVTPQFRITDARRSLAFYVDGLGFQVDWEHEFEPNTPKYMQVSRGNLLFHLSEHYGDGTPGAAVYVAMQGVKEFHAEITAKNYKYLRPGVQRTPWNTWAMDLLDPFGNKLRFNEAVQGD